MTEDEIKAAIVYANQVDPRIQMNGPTLEIWTRVLHGQEAAAVHAAIGVYHERPFTGFGQRPVIEPSAIKRIIQQETERAAAKEAATKALPYRRVIGGLKSRNPDEWDRLVKLGRDERREDLERRGIPLKPWQRTESTEGPLTPSGPF